MGNDGKYYYVLDEQKAFFKLAGTLKYTSASKFDTFLDKLFDSKPDFEDVLVDLSEAVFLDSTNLGFLARIAEYMSEKYNKKVAIYSPNADMNKLLESVGFNEVFDLLATIDKQECELEEVCSSDGADRSRCRMMLDAHQALINVSKKNADKFCDVVDLLQKSVDTENK